MSKVFVCTFLWLAGVLSLQVHGQSNSTLEPIPAKIQNRAEKLIKQASPAVRTWIWDEARDVVKNPKLDEQAVGAAANTYFAPKTPLTFEQRRLLASVVFYQAALLEAKAYQLKPSKSTADAYRAHAGAIKVPEEIPHVVQNVFALDAKPQSKVH